MQKFLQIFKVREVRNKVLIVAGLLIAFRLLATIPVPGIDLLRLRSLLADNQLLGFLNIFSGGGLSNLSIMMLGVGPYITATRTRFLTLGSFSRCGSALSSAANARTLISSWVCSSNVVKLHMI